MRDCTTVGCNGRVGDWVTGSICTTCLLDGKVDPKPTETIPEEAMPVNRFGEDERE